MTDAEAHQQSLEAEERAEVLLQAIAKLESLDNSNLQRALFAGIGEYFARFGLEKTLFLLTTTIHTAYTQDAQQNAHADT